MTKVKICDIRTIEDAILCNEIGADYIGVHQIHAPIDDIKLKLLSEIKKIDYSYKVVLVTKESKLDKLWEILCCFSWDYVQLHFPASRTFIINLKQKLLFNHMPIGIIGVMETAAIDDTRLEFLMNNCDYILFDKSFRGGTGIESSIETLLLLKERCNNIDFFIAGGLNPFNVSNVIEKIQPYAVDVQSGVEMDLFKHRKDREKLSKFILQAKK